MPKSDYTEEELKSSAEHAKILVEKHLVGKKTEDFLMLSPNNRHFLFTTRMYYLRHVEEGRPFYCTPKQLKFLQDLIEQAQKDPGDTQKVEIALNKSIDRLKKKLSPMFTEEAKKIAEELGMDTRKIRNALQEKFYG